MLLSVHAEHLFSWGFLLRRKSTSQTYSVLLRKLSLRKILEPICGDGRRQSLPSANRFPPPLAVKLAPNSTLGHTGAALLLEAPESVPLVSASSGRRRGVQAGHGYCEGHRSPCPESRGHRSPRAASLTCRQSHLSRCWHESP